MLADNMTAQIPTLFRTYRASENQSVDCEIWEAARATTAAPTYFAPITIGIPEIRPRYIGGSMGCNNPITQVRLEAKLLFPDRHVACIVSIGSGRVSVTQIPDHRSFPHLQQFLPRNFYEATVSIATDCEDKHQETLRQFEIASNIYFRFNVDGGMDDVGVDEWRKRSEVTAHTSQYLRMPETGARLSIVIVSLCDRPKRALARDMCE